MGEFPRARGAGSATIVEKGRNWGLRPVPDLQRAPFSSLCRIRAVFGKDRPYLSRGTGFFISDDRIATAGHVLYDPRLGGYAQSVEVYVQATPATGGPHAFWTRKNYFVSRPYFENLSPLHDFGVIAVPRPGSAKVLAMREIEDAKAKSRAVLVAGYPSPKADALFDEGPVTAATSHLIHHQVDTVGGMSGGALFDDEIAAAIGLHVRGFDNRMPPGVPPSATGIALTSAVQRWLLSAPIKL